MKLISMGAHLIVEELVEKSTSGPPPPSFPVVCEVPKGFAEPCYAALDERLSWMDQDERRKLFSFVEVAR